VHVLVLQDYGRHFIIITVNQYDFFVPFVQALSSHFKDFLSSLFGSSFSSIHQSLNLLIEAVQNMVSDQYLSFKNDDAKKK